MADKPFSAAEIAAFKAADAAATPTEFSPEEITAFQNYEAQLADQEFAKKGLEQNATAPWWGAAVGSGITASGMGAGKGIDVAKSMFQDKAPIPSVIRTDNPLYQGHDLHQGAITNAEFNAQQRLANELRTTPGINSVVDSLLRDRSAMAPINAEQMRQEIEANKPFGTKVVDKLGKADNALVRGGSRLGGGAGAGYNAVAGVQHAMDPGWRNKIAAAINAAGAGLGGAAAVAPKGGRASALRPLMTAGSAGLGWLANQIADENAKAGGGRIGALADLTKPALKKLSEVLVPHEGKYFGLTQSDNYGIHDGRWGGNRFPEFQNTSPKHAEDRVVWMNDTEPHANAMAKKSTINGTPTVWSTYIGAPDQLKSNKSVFQEILDSHYGRDLNQDQIDLINARIAALSKGNAKKPVFQEPFDIRDRFATQELGGDTFGGRAALADMLGQGKGVGKTKSGIILPNYEEILASNRDPLTVGKPTSSVGSQLFTVDKTPSSFSPEYHPDYNWTVHGENLNTPFEMTPHEFAVPDWYQRQFNKVSKSGKTGVVPHGNSWFNYMKDPQLITEDYLKGLQDAGYAKGGTVDDAKKFQLSTGAIEDLLSGQISPSQFPAAAKHDLTHFPKTDKKSVNDMAKEMAMNYGPMGVGALGAGVIKNVGGQWLPTAQRQIEKQLGNLSKTRLPNQWLPTYTDTNKAVNDWANTTGRKYVLNRLGSSEDEIRKLYDQGITHMDPAEMTRRFQHQRGNENFMPSTVRSRVHGGFPEGNTATTEAGKTWEDVTDSSIYPGEAKDYQHPDMLSPEWIKNLDPNTPMHRTSGFVVDLPNIVGMDKLSAALEKDIQAGKLRPEQLNKVSMEDAVRRAHQQNLDAIKALELPKVRPYDSGYSWQDLTHENPEQLDKILKREGDTMQNCIGGYCSDVLEDGTKLYSLRDPAGNPHVNIEVRQTEKGPQIRQVRGKQNELPTEDYLPYVQDFAINPLGGTPYADILGAGDLGLHDVNKIKQHGVIEGSMGPYYGALDRLFPTEVDTMGGRVLAGQHGVKIPTTEMLRLSTEDLPGRYVTQDQLLEHLNAQEPRPIEQGYSKYYKGTENYAGGGRVGAMEALIENAPKLYQGAKDLILPPAENAARTQIIGTLPTYQKAGNMLRELGGQGKTLDFGAGLGEGAKVLNADTFEPFAKNWTPTFTNASDIPSDAYGQLTNLNVLNVMPREMRDQTVSDIGRVLDRNGLGILTTRGKDVMKAQGRPGPEPTSIITSRDTYQKGFSPQELEDYLKYVLGSKFDINKVNLGPAGAVIRKK